MTKRMCGGKLLPERRKTKEMVEVVTMAKMTSAYANKMLKWKAETSLEDTVRSIWKWQLHLAEQEEDKNAPKGGKMLGGS